MRKQFVFLAAVLTLVMGLAACGEDNGSTASVTPGMLVVTNNTGEDLNEMDISVSSEEEAWDEVNLFNGKVLKHGESIEIPVSAFPKNEKNDLSFTGENNSYFKMEVDVKTAGSISVEKGDLFQPEDED